MKHFQLICCGMLLLLVTGDFALGEESLSPASDQTQPQISLSGAMGDNMIQGASRVKEELEQRARSLFEREPLGWNFETIAFLNRLLISLPLKIPEFIEYIVAQSRLLGTVGSGIVFIFLLAALYSLFGQKRVLNRIEAKIATLRDRIPIQAYPYVISGIKVVVAALIPLLLIGIFHMVRALTNFEADWFRLIGHLLGLWAVGALVINLLREGLTRELLPSASEYGISIFRWARVALLYILIAIAVFWSAQVFVARPDVLALLKFAISISIVVVSLLLLLKKNSLTSLLPDLPYRSYQWFATLLNRYYYPLMGLTFLLGLMWCVGFRQLGQTVLVKLWSSVAAFVAVMLFYHIIGGFLQSWRSKTKPSDEAAHFLIRSIRSLLTYGTALVTATIVLNLLGLLHPLRQVMSFPILQIGTHPVTLWIIIKAVLIFVAFVYAFRLLQAYLDYKIYPSIGVDEGLAYALNTFLKYTVFAIGFLVSLKIVGIDLRFLLVFAGAAGIGIGLGLQSMAANIISGFSIIFGGKIRKGDWIEVGDTLGVVTDIYLSAAKVRTRDNIEYLVPNSNLISDVIINYSLSSPYIRIDLAVGVSYDADPKVVEKILVDVATNEPLVNQHRAPEVRFVEYGDNSINFELVFWIDVRSTARRKVRSALYFEIFAELKKAGIEIPYPQRDVHILQSAAAS